MRQRLNIVAILISLFVPWLIFCAMFWTMSFHLHYKYTFICYFLVLVGLCIVGVIGLFALDAVRKKKEATGPAEFLAGGQGKYHEPTWLIFLFGTAFVAWLLGCVGGDANYFNHMEPYYDVSNLNTYPNVDPSNRRGQELMDAGRILFTKDSRLNLEWSMGFKNLDMYCVAPIVSGEGNEQKRVTSYDFWAVGMNCCSGNRPDFHCGEFNNGRAMAGLRLMRDDQRAFYRLAVQQAEAAHTIRADHPLFFEWMQDPIGRVMSWMDEGYKYFLIAIFTHFLFQLFLVVVCCLAFSKLGGLS